MVEVVAALVMVVEEETQHTVVIVMGVAEVRPVTVQ